MQTIKNERQFLIGLSLGDHIILMTF